ncbi:MAG: hypothetical protein ABIC82_00290 [bacterium]
MYDPTYFPREEGFGRDRGDIMELQGKYKNEQGQQQQEEFDL